MLRKPVEFNLRPILLNKAQKAHADVQVNVDGFLRFADYFFDGLFADWTVLDKIGQSQDQVQSTKHQIENVLTRLRSMHRPACEYTLLRHHPYPWEHIPDCMCGTPNIC